MRAALQLWCRGFREAWRSRWLFWLLPAIAIVSHSVRRLVVLLQARSEPALREWLVRPFLSGLTGPFAVILDSVKHVITGFDMALALPQGLGGLVIVLTMMVHAWRRTLFPVQRATTKHKGEVAFAVTLTVTLVIGLGGFVGAQWFHHRLGRAVLLAWVAWHAATTSVFYAGFGGLFLCYVARQGFKLERTYQHVVERFFPLFVYFLLLCAPWIWQLLSPLLVDRSYMAGWLPLEFLAAAIRLAAVALPFLIVAKSLGLTSAIRELPQFYKRTWPTVVSLVTGTLAAMVVIDIISWAVFARCRIEDPLLVISLEHLLLLLKLVVSLGGITGMFLLTNRCQAEAEGPEAVE